MSETTAPLLATRDALAETLRKHTLLGDVCRCGWDGEEHSEIHAEHVADALLASGVVRDPATLADDETLVERVAQKDYDMHAGEGAPDFDDDWVTEAEQALRALAAALTEDRS